MLKDGEKLVGRYRIENQLGKGGMGAVYRAYDELKKRPVAIKEFALGYLPSEAELPDANQTVVRGSKPAQLTREKALEQFKHEAELLVDLHHPNLPEIFDFFILGTEGYIVMTLIEGRSLADALEANGQPFAEETVRPWILQILDALIYCHTQGVIHRDIKPENLLLAGNDQIYLVDFGIAKPFISGPSATTTGARAYSPGFAPTEQYAGKGGTDPRSDLYSLGAVAYCLLTCEIPTDAAERMSEDNLPQPRSLNPSISAQMEGFILACMQLRKAERPANALVAKELLLDDTLSFSPPPPVKNRPQTIPTPAAPARLPEEPAPRPESSKIPSKPSSIPESTKAPLELASPFRLTPLPAETLPPYVPDLADSPPRGKNWGKILLFGVIGLAIFLLAWQLAPKAAQPVATVVVIVEVTATPVPVVAWEATAAPTAVPPSPAPEPTSTPIINLPVGENSSYPLRGEVIRPENIGQVVELARWGKGTINQALWSPDGSQIAVASSLGLYLYNAESFALVNFIDTGVWVNTIDFSPDGETLAAGLLDGSVQLWDVWNGAMLYSLQAAEGYSIRSLAFSPDGFSFATASSENILKLWQSSDGSLITTYSGPSTGMRFVDFSSDGSMLVSWSRYQPEINFWELSSGTLLRTDNFNGSPIYDLTFSPNNNLLGLGNQDGAWGMWDVSTNGSSYRIGPNADFMNVVIDITFSPDGNLAAVGSYDGDIIIFSTSENIGLARFTMPGGNLRSLSFSPDGQSLLALNYDFTLSILSIPYGELLRTFSEHANNKNQVSLSPDGSQIASTSDNGQITIYSVWDGSLIQVLEGNANGYNSLAYAPDGNLLAAGSWDGPIDVWSIAGEYITQTLNGHSGAVNQVVFSPDGDFLASASDDQTVRLWQVSSGTETASFNGHTDSVRDVVFSPDGNYLASCSYDYSVRYWRIANRELMYTFSDHTDWVYTVDFSPDGQTIVSGSYDASLRLWDAGSGTLIRTLETGQTIQVVKYSADGSLLITATGNNSLAFWNPEDGGYLGELFGHRSSVESLAFNPDQTLLVSSSYDNTIRLWGIP